MNFGKQLNWLDETEQSPLYAISTKAEPKGFREHDTDLGNARRLVRAHGKDLRYIKAQRGWLVWNGRYWGRDETGEVERRVKDTIGRMYGEASKLSDTRDREELVKWALKSESNKSIQAMIKVAQSDASLSVKVGDLDTHPRLLNVDNGTIDLRTGKLQAHDPENLITQIAPVEYDPAASAPQWRAFLDTVTGGDQDLATYLQRLAGYTLTGDVSEQILVFMHGYGANGKTTFLNVLQRLLGTYAKQADPNLLMARNGNVHPTGMADLVGSRFVVCSEVDEGRHMAEATVKQLTGGDRVKARFMHADFFEFDPTHKIWLAANHKPIVKGTDHAFWRRMRLVPFTVTIPERQRDTRLPEKLLDEHPGILNWAIEGCLEWQVSGLADPAAVRNATNEYRTDSDLISQFITQQCGTSSGHDEWTGVIYKAYTEWCEQSGLNACSAPVFGRRLAENGIKSFQSCGKRKYRGIRLRK